MNRNHILLLLFFMTVIYSNAQKMRDIPEEYTFILYDSLLHKKTNDYPSKKVFIAIKKIILEEKIALKKEIKNIENQLNNGEITNIEAEWLKKEAASVHASNIENRIALQDIELKKIIQDYTDNQLATINIDSVEVEFIPGNLRGIKLIKKRKMTVEYLERLRKHLIEANLQRSAGGHYNLAFGLNNVVIDNKLSKDYKIGSSKFYEYGLTSKYRLSKNPSPYYFRYGASFLFNSLRLKENRSHVKTDDDTNLIIHTQDLKGSRLKNVQLIFPVHFEIDLSKPDLFDDNIEISNREKDFRFGIGGYGGFRLYSKQILKYEENDISIKEKSTDNFNLNNFTYGLSGYFGYRFVSLYFKYDINTLFKNSNSHGVSLGIRLEK